MGAKFFRKNGAKMATDNLTIEYVPIGSIEPYENNARKHSKKDLAAIEKSIQEFGFNDPIGIWNNKIIEGHGRLMAAQELGFDKVPVIRLDNLTDEQRRAYALAHNKTAELSDWDFDVLAEELKDIADIDMTEFGFDMSEIPEDVDIIEDEIPDVPEEPIAKRGEVWKLGVHRVMCGDSTNPEDMRILMGGVAADLYLTDPPYNVDYTGKTKDALKIENDTMGNDDFRQFLQDAFLAAKDNMKAGAAFYIWHADSEGYNFRGACFDVGLIVRECLVWVKNSLVLGRQDYQWQHEPCLYGWVQGTHSWYSDRKQTTVLNFDRPSRNAEHPTMKPVALFDYLIRNSTKKNDVVLDSFGGSGTTIIACEQNGRKGYCMELDPKYVDVIIKRWENITGKKAVLLNDTKAVENEN